MHQYKYEQGLKKTGCIIVPRLNHDYYLAIDMALFLTNSYWGHVFRKMLVRLKRDLITWTVFLLSLNEARARPLQAQWGWNMSISKMRCFLYWLTKLLGDISAAKKGTIGNRIARRATGKVVARFLWKLFK